MRLSRRLVPAIVRCTDVVVLLGVIRAIVASVAQVSRVETDLLGKAYHASHVLAATTGRIDAGDDRRPGRRAPRLPLRTTV